MHPLTFDLERQPDVSDFASEISRTNVLYLEFILMHTHTHTQNKTTTPLILLFVIHLQFSCPPLNSRRLQHCVFKVIWLIFLLIILIRFLILFIYFQHERK